MASDRADELRLLRQFAHNADQGLVIAAEDGRVLHVNPYMQRLLDLGETPDLSGVRLTDWFTQDSKQRFETEVVLALTRFGSWQGDLQLRDHAGRVADTYESFAVFEQADGRRLYIDTIMGAVRRWANEGEHDLARLLEQEVAKRRSLEQHQALFLEHFPGIAIEYDKRGPVFMAGKVDTITGLSAEDFLSGKVSWSELQNSADRDKINDFERNMTGPGGSVTRRYRIRRADGDERWVEEHYKIIRRSGHGGLAEFSAVFDITERKAMEERLVQNAATLRSLINAICESTLLIDTRGNILEINATAATRLQSTVAGLRGRSLWDVLPHELAATRRSRVAEVVQTLRPLRFEDRELGRDVLNSFFPMLTPKGEVKQVAMFGYDISQLKHIERELRESEERYHRIYDVIEEGYLLTDATGEILAANPSAARILGYPDSGALEGKSLARDLISEPEQTEALMGALDRAERVRLFPLLVRRADGKLVYIETNMHWVRGEANVSIALEGTFHDVTERIGAEVERERYLRALKHSNEELERFAYVASHDLQEPLRKIKAFSELLVERFADQSDEKARRYAGIVTDGTARMQRLINDLLSLSRVSSQAQPFMEVELSSVLHDTVRALQVRLQSSEAELVVPPLPTVYGDRTQLGQLLMNLFSNALKFRGEQAPIVTLAWEDRPRHHYFSVRDNGIGIDPRHQKQIFEVFTRLHTRDEYPGSGIGLSICQKIVQRHGGEIWVTSQVGQGACFHFTLAKAPEVSANALASGSAEAATMVD
jgi:PAS domain S-box-containing protein